MKKKNIYFNEVTVVGFVKNLMIMISKKVPVIFHNLRGYHSHLIFNELDKFDVKLVLYQMGLKNTWHFF